VKGYCTWHTALPLAEVSTRTDNNLKGEHMAAGDIILVQLDQSIDSDNIQNILWYEVVSDDTSKDNEDALAEQFEIDVIPLWQPCVTADLSLDCIGTQKVFPAPKTAFRELFLSALGTATGQAIPIVAAALLQKFDPAVSGRGKKGHTYISGVSESESNKGRITNALTALLFTLANKLTDNLITVNGGEYKPVWATFSKIAPILVDGAVDWIRSVVMPRIAHIGTRKTPIRKTTLP